MEGKSDFFPINYICITLLYISTLIFCEIHIMNLLIAGFIFALVSSQVNFMR